ncbi:MAG: DUF697 domain-containing protein [Candidatus Midichloria mitochondrii]|uniref:Uncharacterized protein n=1 Tax=Midichloria mitochondrii (strain IricVA) TaxID=696127 RepID=F7XW58_MIDMI|nr:hypothetical protein [Candidatus Midichloria mitochondrii]AEI88907.1 hypothetical protein midi_00608 [Candidatus Midichloria mitochondrii IricVA]MDJ1256774.1 hypothetical protein [Candidatus Midichloria mitochondrii]MDJ1288462.1 hypothetical protein [Candidatus Midichloria mitochondrii]MDJ1299309.1 hypothetical protein [Candidatus Midichloria mitochondrii]MDJ1313427.1 hypothetical protein [Candidatus Midichloria mitochondrii]
MNDEGTNLIQQQAHSSVASKSFYGVGAAYFVGAALVSSTRSLVDVTGNTLNPFVAGVIGGMVHVSKKELQAKQANTEEKIREVKTKDILSRLKVRESMAVTTGIIKGVKDTYIKAYQDIEARDLRILQTENPANFITDYGDVSASGYANRVTRQKILQDNKSISYKALKSANYLESGLKSTVVLTQVGFYNLGFFIGAVVQKSFAITEYKMETGSLPTVATILYGASYVVNAVVVPFRIGMEVCCFVISSALIGLMGFLMGDTTKLETNKETLKIHTRSDSVQQTIINTLSSSASAQDVVNGLRYVYQNYAKEVESMNKSLKEKEGISSFATNAPLKKHDFLRLQMKKLSLDDHSSVVDMIDKLNVAGPTVASTITRCALQCGIAMREHIGKSTNQVLNTIYNGTK